MGEGASHRVMRRKARLDQHLSPLWSPAGPPCDLAQQLEAALRGTKVRKVDSDVSVDDTDQGHVREVQSLCDHLGAKKNVDIPRSHTVEDLRVGPLAARRVYVHPGNARRRKPVTEQSLHLLCA